MENKFRIAKISSDKVGQLTPRAKNRIITEFQANVQIAERRKFPEKYEDVLFVLREKWDAPGQRYTGQRDNRDASKFDFLNADKVDIPEPIRHYYTVKNLTLSVERGESTIKELLSQPSQIKDSSNIEADDLPQDVSDIK